jgi:hypothetical protein
MQRFLIGTGLALSLAVAGCQTGLPQNQASSDWKFPCNYRAFDAGFCDELNGLPNTNFHLTRRIVEGY